MPSFQIKVLDKAIRILELLAQSNRGVRLKDLISMMILQPEFIQKGLVFAHSNEQDVAKEQNWRVAR